MESKSDLNAQFANAFYRKLENQSSPSWLAKLKMLEGKKGKITFGGIPHKAYWFDLKRNHFSIIALHLWMELNLSKESLRNGQSFPSE